MKTKPEILSEIEANKEEIEQTLIARARKLVLPGEEDNLFRLEEVDLLSSLVDSRYDEDDKAMVHTVKPEAVSKLWAMGEKINIIDTKLAALLKKERELQSKYLAASQQDRQASEQEACPTKKTGDRTLWQFVNQPNISAFSGRMFDRTRTQGPRSNDGDYRTHEELSPPSPRGQKN